MGIDKTKYIKLGIFIITGIVLFILALFYIGGKENLFTKTFNVYSIFSDVNGLTKGNSVQYAGISVGTVESIEIISIDKIRVNMNLNMNVQKFIKKDSKAEINSDGLVGNKIVSITAGSEFSQMIINGDSLQSIKPVTVKDIFNNLNESTLQAQVISKELSDIMIKINRGEGTLGQFVNNTSIYDNIDSLMGSFVTSTAQINNILLQASNTINFVSDDLKNLGGSIDHISKNIEDITAKINSSQSLIGTLLTDTVFANNIKGVIRNTNATTANLEMGSFSFYQNMEALKHNFLFKGYFEDLGYWDKSKEEKNYISREERILNKENELNQRELKLREFQLKLDSLRNFLEIKTDSLKLK
ncbi:MAG TPA: MlaD family protein [Ignavibacteria bacterium]|nr:MlaD family protein [Ignavibacteria bacterium]